MHGQPKILFADVNIRTQLTNKTLHCTTNINESATIKEIVNIYKNQYMYLYACRSTLRIVHRTRTLHRFKWHITDNKPTNKNYKQALKKMKKKRS